MFFRIITWMIVIGFIVRIVNKYVRPVFRMTSVTNEHLRKMQEQMNQMNEKMQQPNPAQKKRVKREGDYIDYEEVK